MEPARLSGRARGLRLAANAKKGVPVAGKAPDIVVPALTAGPEKVAVAPKGREIPEILGFQGPLPVVVAPRTAAAGRTAVDEPQPDPPGLGRATGQDTKSTRRRTAPAVRVVPMEAGPGEEAVAAGADGLVAPPGIVALEAQEALRPRILLDGGHPDVEMALQVGEAEGPGAVAQQVTPRQIVEGHGWPIEGIGRVRIGRPPVLKAAQDDLDGGTGHP